MNLSRLIAQYGPLFVDHLIATMPGTHQGELMAQRELMLQLVEGLADTVQHQEHEREQIGRAKFLSDLAVHLIHGQGEITDDQARGAVDTAKVMLDRALELSRK